ncbi:hypothetical protein RBE51_17800 [Pseudomonas taiwanensis]|uniref:hypothetical protein n=1 Tax=Pseudomonas taiwanensis TaxID=470150 RepID=UPI0028DFA57E|nr:hypothetical protein [Pseudomonas taiwanensis]MDT8924665.1 hypothetical protein [Pseudomonas taiwanensis]
MKNRRILTISQKKAFITQVITAFEERNIDEFIQLFSQHGDSTKYKFAKGTWGPTDFILLSELMQNQGDKFTPEDVHALILSLPSIPTLSTLSKAALYLVSFPHLNTQERQSVFGKGAPLEFDHELAAFKQQISPPSHESRERLRSFRRFYAESVVKDQAPEDFLAKFKLCEAMGLYYYNEIRKLGYEGEVPGVNDFERYKQVLEGVSQEHALYFISIGGKAVVSYELLELYGPKAFTSGDRPDYYAKVDYLADFLPLAFAKDDSVLFKSLVEESLHKASLNEIKAAASTLLLPPDTNALSESQSAMLNFMDERAKAELIAQFQREVCRHEWANPAAFVMECLLSGDRALLDDYLRDVDQDNSAPFLNVVLRQFDEALPFFVENGMIGERQKQVVLYLHEHVTGHLTAMAERFQAMNTSHAYRLRELDQDVVVGVPLSELTAEQRLKWAQAGYDHHEPMRSNAFRHPMSFMQRMGRSVGRPFRLDQSGQPSDDFEPRG